MLSVMYNKICPIFTLTPSGDYQKLNTCKMHFITVISGFRLQGVCVESGILVAFYDTGILCWKVQTGELRVEEISKDTLFVPSGEHVVMITNEQIFVKHALAYVITYDEA